MHQLAAEGALDGRFAAVGGYWAQFALPCAYMPHLPVVLGFCSGGSFADTPEAAQTQGADGSAPIEVPETGGSLQPVVGPMGTPVPVVLIVHAADSRVWQCAPGDRALCRAHIVIDGVPWYDGQPTVIGVQPDSGAVDGDQLGAASVKPGEQLVTFYPLEATNLNEVDPRLIGQASGVGVVWYQRLTSGTPDANGIIDGVVRLVANPEGTGMIAAELPLVVADDYSPARVILDSKDWNGNGAYPRFTVSAGATVLAAGDLGSSSTPLALPAGDYTVHAFIATPEAHPVAGPTCDLPLTVATGDDVAYYADFSGSGDCVWTEGSLFP